MSAPPSRGMEFPLRELLALQRLATECKVWAYTYTRLEQLEPLVQRGENEDGFRFEGLFSSISKAKQCLRAHVHGGQWFQYERLLRIPGEEQGERVRSLLAGEEGAEAHFDLRVEFKEDHEDPLLRCMCEEKWDQLQGRFAAVEVGGGQEYYKGDQEYYSVRPVPIEFFGTDAAPQAGKKPESSSCGALAALRVLGNEELLEMIAAHLGPPPTLFVLYHSANPSADLQEEDISSNIIGVYTTEGQAEDAKQRMFGDGPPPSSFFCERTWHIERFQVDEVPETDAADVERRRPAFRLYNFYVENGEERAMLPCKSPQVSPLIAWEPSEVTAARAAVISAEFSDMESCKIQVLVWAHNKIQFFCEEATRYVVEVEHTFREYREFRSVGGKRREAHIADLWKQLHQKRSEGLSKVAEAIRDVREGLMAKADVAIQGISVDIHDSARSLVREIVRGDSHSAKPKSLRKEEASEGPSLRSRTRIAGGGYSLRPKAT